MPAIEVAPDVHQLMFGGVNVALIAEQELTLVDAGLPGGAPGIVELVRRLGRSVEEISTVIITHNHFDHIAGLPELRRLTDVSVIAHQAGLVNGHSEEPYPEGLRRLLRVPFLSPIRRRFVLDSGDVDLQVVGGEVLKPLGGLEVIHTPGHTPGSISLYSPERRLLFIGDALRRHRRKLDMPARMVSTDLVEAVESVRKLALLDFEVLVPGHGRPLTEGANAWVRALLERTGG
jgi:glyoxylase-like metal-dependent hydrolase (beta-lactamase superfamily II)